MIDTHVHVVSGDRAAYPLERHDHPGHEWVDVAPDTDRFLAAMTGTDVAAAVLVQPHGAYGDDNSYTCDSAIRHDRLAAVAIVDMTADDRLSVTERWIERGIAGLRLFSIPTPQTPWLDDPATDDVWALAGEAGLVMGVCVLPAELEALTAAVARHPGHRIVVDHCGFADLADRSSSSFRALGEACATGDLTLKVTTHVIDAWTAEGQPLDELLPTLVDLAGPGHVVWGSDYAQTHDRPYADLVALGSEAIGALAPADRQAVGHDNAAALWFRPAH